MYESTKIFQFAEVGPRKPPGYTKSSVSIVNKLMIRRFSLLSFVCIPFLCSGQLSLNVRHLFGQSETLDTVVISQDGLQASVEYGFRLKEKRLEFHPGLGYRFSWNNRNYDGYFNSIDLDLNTSIYPFDFGGDCDCPTFSKDGNVLKKGFFLEVSPGVAYQILTRLRSDPDNPSKLPIRSKNFVWKIGGAAGIDIGITEQFTLTPMFSATWLSSSEWEGLRQDTSTGSLKDYVYLGAGIRIAYHSDPKRRKRF
jgi:hypothetical protein